MILQLENREPIDDIELELLYDKYTDYCNFHQLNRSMGDFFRWIEENND